MRQCHAAVEEGGGLLQRSGRNTTNNVPNVKHIRMPHHLHSACTSGLLKRVRVTSCCRDGGERHARVEPAQAREASILNWERIKWVHFIVPVVINTWCTTMPVCYTTCRSVATYRMFTCSPRFTCEWRSASSRGSAALRALAIPAQSAPSTWANPSPDPSAESRACEQRAKPKRRHTRIAR